MSGAKVTFKLDNLKQKIKAVANELKDQKFGDHIAEQIVRKIRKDGYNYKTGKSHKPLKQSTIEMRKSLAKYNKTHSDYSPTKSNLTFTGRLLNSIKARITAKSKGIVMRIDVSGSHAPYKGKGRTHGERQSNKSIREQLAKQGRDPLALNKKSKDSLTRILTAIIKERLFK